MNRAMGIGVAVLLWAAVAGARMPTGSLLEGVAPGPDGRIDVLTVFAHQDDESIYGGGAVLLMMQDARVRLHILCMTFDQTSAAMENLGISADHIGRIRVQELETAGAVYGAEEVIQFTYPSRSLSEVGDEKLAGEVLAAMERTTAEVVVTHDPGGLTGHWDHVTTSRVTTAAFAGSPAQVLYYPTLPAGLYRLAHENSNYGRLGTPARPDFHVNIRAVKKLKRMACYAHASQMWFTGVGVLTNGFLLMPYEYFAVGGRK